MSETIELTYGQLMIAAIVYGIISCMALDGFRWVNRHLKEADS